MKDTANKISGEFTFKVLTRKGYLVHSGAICAGLAQAVALFNAEHTPASPVSYAKAYRYARKQGLHVQFAKCSWSVGGGELLPLVVIFSPVQPEITPAQAPDLFTKAEVQASGFQKGMQLPELAALAHSINGKAAPLQVGEAAAIAQAQGLLNVFEQSIEGLVLAARYTAYIAAGYEGEQAIALAKLDELEEYADKVIAQVKAVEGLPFE